MLPSERSLVKSMEKRPFALVAVNSDPKETLKEVMTKEEITWPQFWDGGGTSGPIATAWNVSGWPTIYVIDANGVIRAKGHGGDAIAKMIEECVAEAEKASAPAK